MTDQPFWETKTIDVMSDSEWESLCDGCGRCCLQKLQDEDTDEVHYTDIACKLLDTDSCRCSNYKNRFDEVPDCLSVRPLNEEKISWLPSSCAYRRLASGQKLASWHPLISGNPLSVVQAGISVSGRCVPETTVPLIEWPSHLITWAK
jgi:uncharacterized cysteine cluster protein YcgN (CxxCxxCC family)